MVSDISVCVVDDDTSMRDALATLFEAAGYSVKSYESAEGFLTAIDQHLPQPGCVILDVRLPAMSGLELNRIVKDRGLPLPVIIITGHGDIPMAITAVKDGAFDFVEKPFDPKRLLELVRQAASKAADLQQIFNELTDARRRFAALTQREQEVMSLVVEGLPTKVIAARLQISPRTAETHRARVMEKMAVESVASLVRLDQMLRRRPDPEGTSDKRLASR